MWTKDIEKAQRVANQLRHGTIWINDYHPYVPQAEWGGFQVDVRSNGNFHITIILPNKFTVKLYLSLILHVTL